jgi:hypothetical protein
MTTISLDPDELAALIEHASLEVLDSSGRVVWITLAPPTESQTGIRRTGGVGNEAVR